MVSQLHLARFYHQRAQAFISEAHSVLGVHEQADSRVVHLRKTYDDLTKLNITQDELFRQALRCAESGLFRASHVMGWAAFMDYLQQRLCEDGCTALNSHRPKWAIKDVEHLKEKVNEFQLVDVAREANLCSKSQGKGLHGLLNKRNECAHPSDFFPGINETLGYLSELLTRIDQISARSLVSATP